MITHSEETRFLVMVQDMNRQTAMGNQTDCKSIGKRIVFFHTGHWVTFISKTSAKLIVILSNPHNFLRFLA
ncbi:MAG: hypothetical protein QNJ47_16770 [Nostocaceae cyanobacterium]|nr:hypothetical protein [Nostocaceae cyanobacterium]